MDADTWGRRIAVSTGELGARFERRGAWNTCVELAKRWEIENAFTEGRTEGEWIRRLYEGDRERSTGLPTFDRLLEDGLAWRADRAEPFVALADWRHDPDAHPLDTPSGKIELFSELLAAAAETLRDTPDEGAVTPIPYSLSIPLLDLLAIWNPEVYVGYSMFIVGIGLHQDGIYLPQWMRSGPMMIMRIKSRSP